MTSNWKARVLAPVRHFGRRVAWTPHFMGFGNVLLVVHWAQEETRAGRPTWVLALDSMRPWLNVFPGLGNRVLTPDRVRFTDRRVLPWKSEAPGSTEEGYAPVDMTSIEAFITDVLLPGSPDFDGVALEAPDRLVVNVRRGDYYAVPEIRAEYGFDVEAYLRVAVAASVERDGPPREIVVISDGLDWCRARLGWLATVAPVIFHEPAGAVDAFTTVATARRLVITNSTFSYWAAYLSTVLHGDNHASIWAPRFFDRTRNGGRSWLLDERWSIIENLPNGWDEHTE